MAEGSSRPPPAPPAPSAGGSARCQVAGRGCPPQPGCPRDSSSSSHPQGSLFLWGKPQEDHHQATRRPPSMGKGLVVAKTWACAKVGARAGAGGGRPPRRPKASPRPDATCPERPRKVRWHGRALTPPLPSFLPRTYGPTKGAGGHFHRGPRALGLGQDHGGC